jgi:NTE family protein
MALTRANLLGGDVDLVLILSGGNALGAFQGGVYEALHDAGLEPDWIVGTSIGAINGALIAGNEPSERVEALRKVWYAPGGQEPWWPFIPDSLRRTSAVNWTLAAGRAGLFGPVLTGIGGLAVYETDELRRTLLARIDFDRINIGPCRFTATAVDLETGDDVVFDSTKQTIMVDHLRASAALPVLYPPIGIEGRWLVDGGVSANLALDPFFESPPRRPTLCIAVDLLPLAQALPRTIGEAGSRMQDLLFAAQSRHSLARWRAIYASDGTPGITFAKLTYDAQQDEVVGKAMDFSSASLELRWRKGRELGQNLLDAIDRGDVPLLSKGLGIHDGLGTRSLEPSGVS